jgi:hypothetical protein
MARRSRADLEAGRDQSPSLPLRDEDLPHYDDPLWVKRRKIRVVAAVRSGMTPLYLALRRFNITVKQFVEWEREVDEEIARRKNTSWDTVTRRLAPRRRRRRKRTD